MRRQLSTRRDTRILFRVKYRRWEDGLDLQLELELDLQLDLDLERTGRNHHAIQTDYLVESCRVPRSLVLPAKGS